MLDPKSPKGARGAREARAGRLGVVLDPKSPKGARGVREARAGRRGGVSAPKSPNELIAAVGVVVAVAGVAAGGEEFPCVLPSDPRSSWAKPWSCSRPEALPEPREAASD